MLVPSDILGSCSEATMRRGARDRRGLRSEDHRREPGHRATRCGSTQILSPGTSIAKEHVGTGMGEDRRHEAGRGHDQGPTLDSCQGWGDGLWCVYTILTSTTLESNMSDTRL